MYQQLREYLSCHLDKNHSKFVVSYLDTIPSDTLKIKFDIRFLENNLKTDWALVLLAVSSEYISPDSILSFAMTNLNEESSEAEMRIAIEGLEESPDWFALDNLIPSLVGEVRFSSWPIAYEKLFYAAVLWVYGHWDAFEDPSEALFTVWDDFGGISIGRSLSYHDSWTSDCRTLEGRSSHMKSVCEDFIRKEKRRLSTEAQI